MGTKQFDYAVYVGRFQPFHNGHLAVLKKALEVAETVVVVLGSARHARNIRNPFTAREREEMIAEVVEPVVEWEHRVVVRQVRDHLYSNAMWVTEVQRVVQEVTAGHESAHPKITLIGHQKDRTSGYLDDFPQWTRTHVPLHGNIHATDVREGFLMKLAVWTDDVPKEVVNYLTTWLQKEDWYRALQEELQFITHYKSDWGDCPFPVQFNCTDAVVYKSGHILLIQRGGHPGKGQWALPGGFISQYETAQHAALRELKEETGILVPESELLAQIKSETVFDHPDRSLRGRTFSHAFYFDLGAGPLPQIRGGDDAVRAKWFSLVEIYNMEDHMFEDHIAIIEHFLLANGSGR